MAEYVPGKAIPLSADTVESKTFYMGGYTPQGARRVLTPDEFARYYEYLQEDDDRVSDPVKAAIGLVLDSDLVRVYMQNGIGPDVYDDDLIKFWVNQYYIMKGTDPELYGEAVAEVIAFEEFLVIPTFSLPQTENFKDGISLVQYTSVIAKDALDLTKQTRISAELSEQKLEYEKKKKGRYDFSDKLSVGAQAEYNKWVKRKIYDYLAAIYSVHPVATMPNPQMKKLELPSRKIIVDLVKTGKVTGVQGTEMYMDILNAIITSDDGSEFYSKRSAIFSKYMLSHPITKVLS